MKKLLLVVLALVGLVAADASARYGYYGNRCYDRCAKPACAKVCKPACKPCPAIRTIEEQKPANKCCVRYVRVEEPCIWTKHVSWSCECPSTCQEEFGAGNYESEVVYSDSEANAGRF